VSFQCSITAKLIRVLSPQSLKRNVRFGSKADMCAASTHVRFTPISDRKSGPPRKVMSALPLRADMCGAHTQVCFGP
jgi:hypothetical protein